MLNSMSGIVKRRRTRNWFSIILVSGIFLAMVWTCGCVSPKQNTSIVTFPATSVPSPTLSVVPSPPPSPQPLQTATPPITGTRISGEPTIPQSLGELILHNNDPSLDAVVALSIPGFDTALTSVYVRHGDSYTIESVSDGTYHAYFAFGTNWNPDKKQFAGNVSYLEYSDYLSFGTFSSTNPQNPYLHYTVYELSLTPTMGNTYPITSSQFPKLS